MADIEEIKARIRDMAGRRNNVTFEEILWVVRQLEGTFQVSAREARHGWLFRVHTAHPFMVNRHNPGSKQVKRYSVDDFLDAMAELALYEE